MAPKIEEIRARRKKRMALARKHRQYTRPPKQSESALAKGARGNKHMRRRITEFWRKYSGADAFVCGTGTSLSGFDWTRLNGKLTIGLNDALSVPGFAPAFSIFSDIGIWARYRSLDLDKRTVVVCQGRARDQFNRWEKCTFKDQVWHFNQQATAKACNPKNDDLFCARTVACAAIMMAWKLGARRIFLLGVDGYKIAGGEGGVYYHTGGTKGPERRNEKGIPGTRQVVQDRHGWWAENMKELRVWFDTQNVYQEPFVCRDGRRRFYGSNIFNLSPLSTIKNFQKVKVKTVLGRGCFDEEHAATRHAVVG